MSRHRHVARMRNYLRSRYSMSGSRLRRAVRRRRATRIRVNRSKSWR